MSTEKLYKYRTFDVNTLSMLSYSEVYYADPTKFNDPLDCKPNLIIDVSFQDLEQLCFKMFEAEFDTNTAHAQIKSCRYYADEPENFTFVDLEKYHAQLLSNEIIKLLHLRMKGRGVLSMAGDWKSSLMWSHYADEHKGLCLEYDLHGSIIHDSKKVDYNSSRNLLASSIIDWVHNPSPFNQAEVESKYFYNKAKPWEYEEETRYIAKQGINSAPFHLSGVYFGIRCERPVISSIVKLLNGAGREIEFHQIIIGNDSFELSSYEIDKDEIMHTSPRPSARLAFQPFLTE
jgi:hypothetical protein